MVPYGTAPIGEWYRTWYWFNIPYPNLFIVDQMQVESNFATPNLRLLLYYYIKCYSIICCINMNDKNTHIVTMFVPIINYCAAPNHPVWDVLYHTGLELI